MTVLCNERGEKEKKTLQDRSGVESLREREKIEKEYSDKELAFLHAMVEKKGCLASSRRIEKR